MKRRDFLQFIIVSTLLSPDSFLAAMTHISANKKKKKFYQVTVHSPGFSGGSSFHSTDEHIKDYLAKIRFPDRPNADDIILSREEFVLLGRIVKRLERVRAITGHGNFCVIGFDEALRIGRRYSKVGRFTKSELDFLEMIYFQDASKYGFKGKKQVTTLTRTIGRKDVLKVQHSGNYLFRGASHEKYQRVKKELGEELILTSGIRGVTKQFYLFLNKAFRHGGNLSLASRSLAPPVILIMPPGILMSARKGLGRQIFPNVLQRHRFSENWRTEGSCNTVMNGTICLGFVMSHGISNLIRISHEHNVSPVSPELIINAG
ncbi:hypothetical protein DGMP_31860 [Desulfomarina profundi]|uniref:Uncharacterized protein n=1 Tax=Desulfomarina profundi TaxID=2772557 RepID=A0A8D5JEG8_9BACT|nr:hypothetical protein [Desulfomarina profundi]BCL62493.1 hypothetical protein DGMP_31860 [Desulfomarina profundi]